MYGTASGSCTVAYFGVSSVETLGSATSVLDTVRVPVVCVCARVCVYAFCVFQCNYIAQVRWI